MEDKCGTLTFMAPEIIMDRQYDNLVDIWSTGIIMYILESGGSHPFLYKPKTKGEYIEDIKLKKDFFFPNYFPLIARNIFLKMCKYEPCFRYNVSKSLNHPWITRKNINIPLTVIEDLQKKDKINTFKEMLISMTFLNQLKNILNLNITEIENENISINDCDNIIKRKLNIKKGNIDYDLYPSPYNYYSILKKKKSKSIRELPILTRPSSKIDRNPTNNIKGILKLRSFNTDKKKSERYSIYSKNSFTTNSKININNHMRNLSNNKLNYKKKTFTKSKFHILNILNKNKINNFPSIIPENINHHLRTPIHMNNKISRNVENNSKYLTAKIMRNKENLNLNINCMNQNVINNYCNKKSIKNKFFKNSSKSNIIEPTNLFHRANNNNNLELRNIGSDLVKKIF